MSEAQRRHTRYTVPDGVMQDQAIRGKGIFALIRGWKPCRVKDLSLAGAMVLTQRTFGIGEAIEIRMIEKGGDELRLLGQVANVGRDQREGWYKVGVALNATAEPGKETEFLSTLSERFPTAV